MARIALLIVLAFASTSAGHPAPKQLPQLFPSCADLQWGGCKQISWFNADGSYCSPTFGLGEWSIRSDDGLTTVWFSENGRQYVMCLDDAGNGKGRHYWIDEEGTHYGSEITVKLSPRREMPK